MLKLLGTIIRLIASALGVHTNKCIIVHIVKHAQQDIQRHVAPMRKDEECMLTRFASHRLSFNFVISFE